MTCLPCLLDIGARPQSILKNTLPQEYSTGVMRIDDVTSARLFGAPRIKNSDQRRSVPSTASLQRQSVGCGHDHMYGQVYRCLRVTIHTRHPLNLD